MEMLKEPAILFFILGMASVFFNTKLEIPNGLSRFLSLYFLFAIGFKGGVSLAKSGVEVELLWCMLGGVLLSVSQALLISLGLAKLLPRADAAAIGATYGSVSAVTFVAGVTWLESLQMPYLGGMTAVLALMEAPAIVVALLWYNRHSGRPSHLKALLHESFFNPSVYLLMGSLIIGLISGPFGRDSVATFVFDLFRGLLCFFLMDLGIRSGHVVKKMELPAWLVVGGFVFPIIGASLAIVWSYVVGLSAPQAFLLTTLGAGASYIAVPAALQMAIPEARSGLYLTLALGITFPFNITVGLPLYWWVIKQLLPL
ncbi:MAG: sodium-dependent bicarbonate transport family permease [Bdellovibrionaceae bacterium]|nr:sodium-dependent bicarbonate transport family permease [Pseudobdellovibrionaceae bacterium]MDW8190243.1 sodium-dependent bicarbonate transport family permease [Pseudobdellovibrionaceae bacterium]